MKKQKMLHVQWTEEESATYYVDKDQFSKAHYNPRTNQVTLDSYSGTYVFYLDYNTVILDTGTEVRDITVKNFKVFDTPTV